MAATAIGLDVGTNAVRAVEIEFSDPPLLRRMGQVALPSGAVVDGEVADVAAVSVALQRLWDQAGFKSRAVRVGMSSARVIVRTVEMPRLSHDELISTIRLQLDDYVPLPAEDTVFDIRQMDDPDASTQTVQLLLAATHRDAVEPLLMALRDAKLDATAVDVIPAALALALTYDEPTDDGGVDILLSIGAGTLVVVAARDGEPVFARTITSSCGRLTTDRIASQLAIGELDAERYKRLGPTADPTSAVAVLAAQASVEELIEEVRASLAFYAGQPSARPDTPAGLDGRRLAATRPHLRVRRQPRLRGRARRSVRRPSPRANRLRSLRPALPRPLHGSGHRRRPRREPTEGSPHRPQTRGHAYQALAVIAPYVADGRRGRSGRRRRVVLSPGPNRARRPTRQAVGRNRSTRRPADTDGRPRHAGWRSILDRYGRSP